MHHYQIRKQVICDIIDTYCTESMPYKFSIKPNCKDCEEYNMYIFERDICPQCTKGLCCKTKLEINNCEFYES